MTFNEINEIEDIESYFEDYSIENLGDFYSIKNQVAFPIFISHSYDRTSEIPVKSDEGNEIGRILFLANNEIDDIRSLPEDKLICFFRDNDLSHINAENYIFKYDYLIIDRNQIEQYCAIKKTSPIWGSYFHLEHLPSISFQKKYKPSEIKIIPEVKINNQIYFENLHLSIHEPNPFNRFLKLYHLIELQFDMHTAEKIIELHNQGGKEKEISSLLKEYQREDINRLISIIRQRCNGINSLAIRLNKIKQFEGKARKIFYDYGKESNPLKLTDFNSILNENDLFSENVINAIGGYIYPVLIQKLCSYWIYRIRSSISHNKFGEYIMDINDEEFIVEFGEPLLKEVVTQCFKK
ncbi:MAG: hypothetical protein IM577_08000 [Chitinophagaceae bacterium]|nr:hypothetical protein [Chitinophagaceae bacterium]